MSKLLVVEDDITFLKRFSCTLQGMGHEVIEAQDIEEAFKRLSMDAFDIVITDMRMPKRKGKVEEDESGLEVVRKVREVAPGTLVIVMTAYGKIENAVQAMREGAYDYITKPFSLDEIRIRINKALDQIKLLNEKRFLNQEIRRFRGRIVGSSDALKRVLEEIDKVAKTDAPVLIQGETGTGKELVAEAIHENSLRRNKPFVPIHLAAEPRDLVESAIFGHERGSFTGAIGRRIGGFELAHGGTLFLDEIGEISLELQVKLLRVLQNQEFRRIGGTSLIKTDVRIIAATNQNLKEKIKEGKFREDIYFRLNVFPIFVPPLRERKEDIPELVSYFIKKYSNKVKGISTEALEVLKRYDWPGNIRELENIVERMLILSTKDWLEVKDVEGVMKGLDRKREAFQEAINTLIDTHDPSKEGSIIESIKSHLAKMAKEKAGSQKKAAELLGITEQTMIEWLKK